MATVVLSSLNPLALSFVPTSLKIQCKRRVSSPITSKGKINENRDLNLEDASKRLLELSVDNSVPKHTAATQFSLSYIALSTIARILEFMLDKLPKPAICPVLSEVYRNLEKKPFILDSHVLKSLNETFQALRQLKSEDLSLDVKDECRCPPVFGWSIPPDYLGNPFNFKYDCSKKHAHLPSFKEENLVNELKSEGDVDELTLDECYWKVKDILADIHDMISDPISEWDEKYKIQTYLEISDDELDESDDDLYDISSQCETIGFSGELDEECCKSTGEPHGMLDGRDKSVTQKSVWNDFSLPAVEFDNLLPDDSQLLELNTEDVADEDEIERIQKILGECLSPGKREDVNFAECDPATPCVVPCGLWCDQLPPAARETYARFVSEKKSVARPSLRRSFSADDATNPWLLSSGKEASKEKRMPLRKNPLTYLHTLQNSQRYSSYPDFNSCSHEVRTSTESENSNTWGKFDGADSLWKPLPDCLPLNEQNQKSLKRAREMKRQRELRKS